MRAGRLRVLLRVRAGAEERAGAAVRSALAELRAHEGAVDDARRAAAAAGQDTAAPVRRGPEEGMPAVKASDLHSRAVFARRLDATVRSAEERAAETRRRLAAEREAHRSRHAEREAVERLVEADRQRRRRAREAADDESLLDATRTGRRRELA